MALTQVTSIGLKDGEIVNADLHSAASVALSKLASTGALGSAVTATTQSASDDSTKLATTAFVQAAVTSLIDGAPGSLNTLNELAAAINDDSSYATTLTTALATKAVLSGSTNNTIATVTGANALQGEANLTFDGKTLISASGSYPETTELIREIRGGVANGNRFSNRYIKIKNTYTGSVHGGIPIVWEANADGSNNKSYGAITTEGDGAIRFLNKAAGSAVSVGTGLGLSERLRISSNGQLLQGSSSTDQGWAVFYRAGSSGGDAGTAGQDAAGDKGVNIRSDMGPSHTDLTGVDNYTLKLTNGAYAGTGIANPQGTIAKILFNTTTYNGWNAYAAIACDTQGVSGGRGDLAFLTASGTSIMSERLRITSSGALGTNATVRAAYGGLDLQAQGATNLGTLTLGASGGQNGIARNANTENQFRIMSPTYADPSKMFTVMYGASGSSLHEINYGGGTGWAYAANLHRFFTAANKTTGTGTERLRITAGGVVSIGGRDPAISANVGLEISGHATTEIRLKNTAGGWNSSDGLAIQKWSNGNSYFWEYDAQDILFGTSNSERIRIKSTGEVGINKSSPNSGVKLHVGGTARFDDDVSIITGKKLFTNSSQGQLTIQGGATYPGSAIKFAGGQGGATDQGQMIFYAGTDTSLTEVGRITNDGNHRRAKHSRFATRIDYNGGNEAAHSKIPFVTPHVNIGSDFDSSNERYVAPVDGDYAFWFHTNVARSGAGNYYATWKKNGSEVAAVAGGRMYDQHSGSGWNNLSGCLMMNLDEGDYIEIFNGGVAVNYDGGNYGQWMGWLVG